MPSLPRGSKWPRHRARKPGQTQNDDKKFQTSPATETLPSTSTDPGETILYERSLPAGLLEAFSPRYGRYERYDYDTYRLFASHLGSVVFAKARTWLESPRAWPSTLLAATPTSVAPGGGGTVSRVEDDRTQTLACSLYRFISTDLVSNLVSLPWLTSTYSSDL